MRLFLDTEFDEHRGSLISMALVCDKRCHEWYEVAYVPPQPRPFAAEHVIPKLEKDPIGYDAFDESLGKFLSQCIFSECEIIADWPADFQHLCSSLTNYSAQREWTIPVEFVMRLIKGSPDIKPKNPHNALSDARALRDWYMATVK